MSRLGIYSVRDTKAEVFKNPFVMRSNGDAVRGFTTLVNDGRSEISMYPEDFSLYHHGYIDELTGEIEGLVAPVNLGIATSYKKPKEV